jgi:hypothetical protein
MEFFTATGKLQKVFLTNRDVHHGWHSIYRYDIQFLAIHASTWANRYSSLLQWSVPKGTDHCSSEDVCRVTRGAHIEHL